MRYRDHSHSKSEPRSWLLTAALAVVGLALILAALYVPSISVHPASRLIQALGEAALIGATIERLIEYRARVHFAGEVGRDVFLTLFAGNAPPSYVRQLERVCRADRLVLDLDTRARFKWFAYPDILQVDLEARGSTENISFQPWARGDIWLMRSVDGTPGTEIHSYDAMVTLHDLDDRRTEISRVALDDSQLARLREHSKGGGLTIRFGKLKNAQEVPPGAIVNYTFRCTVYLRVNATLPLIMSAPTLRQTVTISGPAVKDLDLEVRNGIRLLLPTHTTSTGQDRQTYEVHDLALPDAAMLVQWQLRANDLRIETEQSDLNEAERAEDETKPGPRGLRLGV